MKSTIPNTNSSVPSSGTGSIAVVSLRNVTKYFQSLWGFRLRCAITSASFEVYRGEVFGLVGPAGSGKSTTLDLIAGHLTPTVGKVRVFGGSPRRAAIKPRIGYLPEITGPAPPGVLGFLREPFAGMFRNPRNRQSPARLAQILVKGPDLIVLDNPFSALDVAGREAAKELILTVKQAGKTVILASKTLSDVKGICGRVAVYYGGNVEAVGTFEELLRLLNLSLTSKSLPIPNRGLMLR